MQRGDQALAAGIVSRHRIAMVAGQLGGVDQSPTKHPGPIEFFDFAADNLLGPLVLALGDQRVELLDQSLELVLIALELVLQMLLCQAGGGRLLEQPVALGLFFATPLRRAQRLLDLTRKLAADTRVHARDHTQGVE